MTERRWRTLTALLAVAAALVLTHQVERYRAARSPGGWSTSVVAEVVAQSPRLTNSQWVLGADSQWVHEDQVGQWFLRARLTPGAQLTVRHGVNGPAVVVSPGEDTVVSSAAEHRCDGQLPVADSGDYSVVFERTQDGYVVRSGEARVACSAPGLVDAAPMIEASGGTVYLVSIGTQEWASGVPVSSLGWLGGVALVGFLWMLLLEWERARGVAWPVVIGTGVPCLLGALLLWTHPGVQVMGLSISLVCVLIAFLLKGLTIVVGGSASPRYEE